MRRAKQGHRKSQREVRSILKKQTGRQQPPSVDVAPDGAPVHGNLGDVRSAQQAEQAARDLMPDPVAIGPREDDDVEVSLRAIMPDADVPNVPYVHHEQVVLQDMPWLPAMRLEQPTPGLEVGPTPRTPTKKPKTPTKKARTPKKDKLRPGPILQQLGQLVQGLSQ